MQNLVLKKTTVSQTETVLEILDISVYQSDNNIPQEGLLVHPEIWYMYLLSILCENVCFFN